MLLFILVVSSATVLAATDKIVCYHGSWSAKRTGDARFTVADIDPFLCTHLAYAFVGVNGTTGSVITLDRELDIASGNFKAFTDLKKKNHKLKTLLSVGGWDEGSVNYSKIVGDSNLRAEFVRSALHLVRTYDFDGFDLDWEYPAQRGGVLADKANFITLIKELRSKFHKYGLVITAAVAATGSGVDISYDVPELNKYLDWINLMTYDLHGSWDGLTGNNAPLYASSIDKTADARLLNVAASVEGWIRRGACPSKLVVGLPLYGRTYILNSSDDVSLGASIKGPGTSDTLRYNEICLLLKTKEWTYVWDQQQKVPHIYKGDEWISYDNVRSLEEKIKYVKAKKLGGVMVWSIESDDFRRACGRIKNPLLSAIKKCMKKSHSGSNEASLFKYYDDDDNGDMMLDYDSTHANRPPPYIFNHKAHSEARTAP